MSRTMRTNGCCTKRSAIESGLRLLVQANSQKRLRNLRGQIVWEGDLEEIKKLLSTVTTRNHSMSTRDKIIKAQMGIIDRLADCEKAISRLYARYAIFIPGMMNFWQELSTQEEAHALLIRSMHTQLEQGAIFQNIGRFDSGKTDTFFHKINEARKYAEESPPTPREAIETAIGIESSILDAHFYDIVKSDDAVYRIIAHRLSGDTRTHVSLVQNQLMEILSDKDMQNGTD